MILRKNMQILEFLGCHTWTDTQTGNYEMLDFGWFLGWISCVFVCIVNVWSLLERSQISIFLLKAIEN